MFPVANVQHTFVKIEQSLQPTNYTGVHTEQLTYNTSYTVSCHDSIHGVQTSAQNVLLISSKKQQSGKIFVFAFAGCHKQFLTLSRNGPVPRFRSLPNLINCFLSKAFPDEKFNKVRFLIFRVKHACCQCCLTD